MHSCYNICMYSLQQRIHEFTDCFIDKYILCFISKGLVCVQVNNKKFSRQYIAEKLSRLALNTNLSINHEFTYPRFLLKAPKLESTNFIDFRVFLILIYILLFSDLDLLLDILLWQDSTPIMCYQGVGLPVQQELFPIHQNRMGKLDYRY